MIALHTVGNKQSPCSSLILTYIKGQTWAGNGIEARGTIAVLATGMKDCLYERMIKKERERERANFAFRKEHSCTIINHNLSHFRRVVPSVCLLAIYSNIQYIRGAPANQFNAETE